MTAVALIGIPRASPGDDLLSMVERGLQASDLALLDGDVLCITSKLLSRIENRFANLDEIQPSAQARQLASVADKDPRLVELILAESVAVSRATKGVLIVRHRLGFVCANAGIDESNVGPQRGHERTVLLLPEDPQASAQRLRERLREWSDKTVGVVITDSHGRPFRLGTVGVAIGCAGLPALWDQRGRLDLDGRPLQHTETALADQVASLADLVAGQANEGTPVVLVRGLGAEALAGDRPASDLCRPEDEDLYA